MAKLPRYRPLGAKIASLPSVNFAATGQAQSRVAQTIAGSLDRMSSFAFREAETQAKIEGAEYGAGNPPTIQQLMDAETPSEREALIPGGKGTVYDRAARQAALDAVASNLDTSARKQITALRLQATETGMSTTDLQTKIDGVINGYASAMSDVNPAYGRKLRAGVSAAGNNALVSHANKLAEIDKKQRQIEAIKGIDAVKQSVPDIIARGDVVDGPTVNQQLGSLRQSIFDKAGDALDPALMKQQLDDFDKIVDKTFVGGVRDWLIGDPNARWIELQSGKIEDPIVKSIVANMNDEQRREAVEASFEVLSRDLALDAQLDSKADRLAKDLSINLRGEIAREIVFPSGRDVDAMIEDLSNVDPEAGLVMQDRYLNSPSANDTEAIVFLNAREALGRLTHEDLISLLDDQRITFSEYQKRFDRLERLKGEDYQVAVNFLRNEINPAPSPFPGDAERLRNQQIGDITNELIIAIQNDPGLNKLNWMRSRLKELEKPKASQEQKNLAKSTIEAWAKQNGYDGDSVQDIRNAFYGTKPTSGAVGAWALNPLNAKLIAAFNTLEEAD